MNTIDPIEAKKKNSQGQESNPEPQCIRLLLHTLSYSSRSLGIELIRSILGRPTILNIGWSSSVDREIA